jgi:uncharacterized protein YraI
MERPGDSGIVIIERPVGAIGHRLIGQKVIDFDMTVFSSSQRTLSRRMLVKQTLSGVAALAVGSVLLTAGVGSVSGAAGPEPYITSVALNLRAQPNLSAAVLLVIPAGGKVGYQDESQNGFMKVAYNGTIGWAKSDYLSPAGSEGTSNYAAAYRGQAVTSSSVNMRSGGGLNFGVIQVLPAGATVEVYDDYANYFWLVKYNGEFGWVHADYLIMDYEGGGDTPVYTGMGTTTTTVNLRAGAGTGYEVLAVVPEGASIELYAGPAGNWARVRYNGQFGYIHSDYVAGVL